jgi:RNA-directed DNA polymerase
MATGDLIGILNPKIRGWGNYYKHSVAKRTFGYIDNQIFKSLYRWAKRRHPNKSTTWIVSKYFRTTMSSEWKFKGISERNGQKVNQTLFEMVGIPIERHIKIKSAANPYDPSYAKYLQKRSKRKKKKVRNTWFDLPLTAL